MWALCLHATIAPAAAVATAPATRVFWVRNPGLSPVTFRRTTATLRNSGTQSLIYVEDKLTPGGLSPEYLSRLGDQLERAVPGGAFVTGEGLVSLEVSLFGPLSPAASQENRLLVLFADLGEAGPGGEFHDYDLLSDASAQKLGCHSNEANVIYVNGFQKTENGTGGIVARELEGLLSASGVRREAWLADSIAEGTMLLTGYFGDQDRVDNYLKNSGQFPLVTPTNGQLGPQLLFSSFLLDALPSTRGTAIGGLSHLPFGDRHAAEKLFQDQTQSPLSFDAIFSNFISYVFDQSAAGTALPNAWHHSPSIHAPEIAPYFTYKEGSGELVGKLAPYSFVAIDLAQELSPTAEIHVSRADPQLLGVPPSDCAQNAAILWKPVNKTRIAVYAVGCDPGDPAEMVQFRLKILDQPSLSLASPFKLLR